MLINLFKQISGSKLLSNSVIYMVSNVINASVPFLLLPFLTSNLSTAQFGLVSLFMTFSGFISPFIGMNSEGSIMVNFTNSSITKKLFIWNCIFVSFCSLLILLTTIIIFNTHLSRITSLPLTLLVLAVIVAFFKFQIDLLLAIKQSFGYSIQYGLIQIGYSILNVLLTFIFINKMESKLDGRLYGILLSTILFAFFSWIHLKRINLIQIKNYKKYINAILSFGFGLLPHSIGGLILVLINRFIVAKIMGLEAAGIYSLASQIALVIGFITLSFNNAYVPWLYNKISNSLESKDEKIRIVRLTYLYFIALLIFTVLYVYIAPHIFKIFIDQKFDQVYKLLPFIAFGYWFQGLYFMVVNYIIFLKKTVIQSVITVFTGLISIPITYYLTYNYGIEGTCVAFSFSYLILFLLSWILSNKLYHMPWFNPLVFSRK
jgi:O-antigen/teichoic acid export membrane protein